MSIVSAIVLYAVVWFMTMFVVLPINLRTQGDEGEIVPGTQAGAPANFNVRKTMWKVTLWATPVYIIIAGTILSGVISVSDFDMLGVLDEGRP